MRVAVDEARVEADDFEELAHAGAPVAARADPVHDERLRDDVADGHARVERRVRVLEDDLQLAPHLAHLLAAERRQLAPVEADRAAGRLEQPQDAVAGRGLARAGLADEAERLALPDLEADPVDGADVVDGAVDEEARLDREVLLKVGDLEERRAVRAHPVTPAASREPARSLVGCADRTQCPGRSWRSSGGVVAQVSLWLAYGQRGANRHAGGGAIRSGGRPGIAVRRPPRMPSPSICGSAPSRASVYGCSGRSKRSSVSGVLDDLAGVHDDDVVRGLGDDAHVVRDDDHRHVVRLAQVLEEVEDLGLDGHVERRRRLVGDQQLRVAGERDRDHHPLAHPAREPVRVVVEPARRRSGSAPPRGARPPASARPPCPGRGAGG